MLRALMTAAAGISLLVALPGPCAHGEVVRFYVDGELVARLQSETIPASNRIKAAGRSYGSSRRGLYDNIYVELPSGVICDDSFETLDLGFWVTYGSPTPYIVSDFGNAEPCLCTAGDSSYDSGLASHELYDWSGGFLMMADFYMSAGNGGLEFGIAHETEPGPTGLGHTIGVQWKNSHNVMHIRTDLETVDIPLPSFEEWHTIAISASPKHRIAVPFFTPGPDSFYISITDPQHEGVYWPCAPDVVSWDSNIPASPGSPDVLDLYWRECGGDWHWFADDNNDGAHPWSSAPCSEGCYEVRIVYREDLDVRDTVTFEVAGGAETLYVNITSPEEGESYSPCAPDLVTWESNIPAEQGSPADLSLFWRECEGAWQWFASDNNDGAHSWSSAPCDPGCYQVKIVYDYDPTVSDVATFEVVGAQETLYVNISSPADGEDYDSCPPDSIVWSSNVSLGEGDVFALYWRVCGGDWSWIANSSNDGAEPWAAPCEDGCYEIKIVYEPRPTVRDDVTFTVDDGLPPPPPGDPGLMMFVDFSGDAQSHYDVEGRADPAQYTIVTAYIGVARRSYEPNGLTSLSFRLNSPVTECPGVLATQSFTNLLPGNLAIGDPFDATGVTLASTECMTVPFGDIVYIGYAEFFYLGGECDVLIRDHLEFPRWVVDCQEPGEVSPYCVWKHGGIGKDPLEGDEGCYPHTAVEQMSWGAIKAMYR